MDPFTRRIRRIRGGQAEELERAFPLEVPVSIYANASLLAVVSATPVSLEDLVLGFLFTERIVEGPGDVAEISAQSDGRRAQVWATLRGGLPAPEAAMLVSGCGRGITFLCPTDLDALPRPEPGTAFRAEDLRRGLEAMRGRAEAYRAGGGIHAAACFRGGALASMAEDVGRHNAADKAIGSLLREGRTPRGCALLSTGRVSSEIVLKAAVAGCPAVVSLTGATSRALEAADALGIAVAAYARGDRMDVCSHPERILEG